MRYASIRDMDISNGEGIGIALFVQGCHFHCKNCFNSSTWDFEGGHEWTLESKQLFMKLADNPYVSRISILGGEPLENCNIPTLYRLIDTIKNKYPQKKIWIYSGYEYQNLTHVQRKLIEKCDIMVDGLYDDSLRDIRLKYRGSSNQRVIDIQKTIESGSIVELFK